MKKLAILPVAVLLFACNSKTPKAESVENSDSLVIKGIEVVDTTHNARTSLDYVGVYKGKTPSASGEGIEVTIVLGDSTYTKEMVYVGKSDKPFKSEGKYSWDGDGSIVILEGEDKPNQYFVGENTLTQLDIDGQKIVGDLADMYVLKK